MEIGKLFAVTLVFTRISAWTVKYLIKLMYLINIVVESSLIEGATVRINSQNFIGLRLKTRIGQTNQKLVKLVHRLVKSRTFPRPDRSNQKQKVERKMHRLVKKYIYLQHDISLLLPTT